jgi:hypothetical protein
MPRPVTITIGETRLIRSSGNNSYAPGVSISPGGNKLEIAMDVSRKIRIKNTVLMNLIKTSSTVTLFSALLVGQVFGGSSQQDTPDGTPSSPGSDQLVENRAVETDSESEPATLESQVDVLRRRIADQEERIKRLQEALELLSKQPHPENSASQFSNMAGVTTDPSERVAPKNETPNVSTTPAQSATRAQVEESSLPKGLRGLEMGALWYLSYQNGSKGGTDYGQFVVKRGYINVVKKFTPWLETRITPDVYQDANGNMSLRLKYAYAKFITPTMSFIYKPSMEFGIVHSPWLDYEENLNGYRDQDTMFEERNGNFASADFGAMFAGYFGGEMSPEYKANVSNKYAGKYGSFALAVMNGGGYMAPERNKNKVVEGRLTLRPIPNIIPGLQFSYFGLIGQGNLASTPTTQPPDWRLNMGFISYESKYLTLTGQYLASLGNQSATALNANGTPARQNGYSFFGEIKMPSLKSSIIGRWDHYNPNKDIHDNTNVNNRYIVGYSYHLPMGSMLLLDVDRIKYRAQTLKDEWRFQTTIQVSYP